jgi:tricorn protease
MMRIPKAATATIAILLLTAAVEAQEPIRFARTPDISPDGKLVAFSYLGDIWVVETIGGIARPVTMHEAHDVGPVFSPDGRMIAFSSNRHGSYDVFVVPVQGGKPHRLTFDSANDLATSWSPDGKQVLFTSTRAIDFPHSLEMYTVPVSGGRVRRVSAGEGKEGVFSPKGNHIAYVRGQGSWYRKGYRGSSNDDVWICNADGTNNRQLTTFNGQDSSPMWSPDGNSIYYVSECCGTPANVMCQEAAGKNPPRQVTFHKDDGVRKARISGNGEWIVYECGADLWVVSTKTSATRKLAIEVHADDKANTERRVTYTSRASEFALSADEKHVAFVVHGQLFMMPISGGKATRLTESSAFDHNIAWSPDSQKIVFASDRGGQEDLYLLESDDPDHSKLVEAHKFKTTRLTNTPEAEIGTLFSPDGKRVSFIRSGKLWTMNPDGTDQKTVVNDVQVIDYEWSPDSKWLAFARMDGSFASELYIIRADGGPPATTPKNVTRYATYNGGVTWSHDGKKLAFVSNRRQQPAMYVLTLQKPTAPGVTESKGTEIDWDDIHLRVKQAASNPADEGAISMDGSRVAFRSTTNNSDDLWVASSDGGQVTRLTNSNVRPEQIQWSRRLSDLVYFRDGRGQIRMMRTTSVGEPATIPFRAKLTIRRDEEFAEMFEQSWRALREQFYDAKFHGADWEAVRLKYRPLVKHVALKEDLYALISLMVGELNASHLGIAGFLPPPEERTAELGLLFDESYTGPGLKIVEVLKRGPADKRGINLRAGDIVWSIDGVDINGKFNLESVLNDKVGENVMLKVSSSPTADPKDPKAWRRVEIQGASRDTVSNLMYERWVDRNARRVAGLSKGKLGYIHIPAMDEDGLDRFVRALYSDNFDKEAIVLDVRYNGGGFTHDQILNYLGAKEHTFFRHRNGGEGMVLRPFDRKWTRPLVLLINNRSYSDAEIFPHAFRTLGLGKLVGQPTGGHVIGTTSVRLIDGSVFRVPRTGVFTAKGVNMEKEGVKPDVEVVQHPDQLAKGQDPQLEKAVEVLVQTVAEWKKEHPSVAHKAEGSKPPASAVATPRSAPMK